MKTLQLLVVVAGVLLGANAWAEEPAYLQVQPGQTAEIKGTWNNDGVFAATEIEILPASRRPKLRGTIEAVDTTKQAIRVFGQWVAITPTTQFLDMTDSLIAFSKFVPKNRVEVSCKIDSTGRWIARHVRIHNVKASDKVKGTVTRIAYDGKSPDTLIIESLSVLVTDKTEVFKTLGGTAEADSDSDSTEAKVR